MEENFDIDAHINKIKAQMDENNDISDPDNSMFRADDNEALLPPEIANNEPPLENYASEEPPLETPQEEIIEQTVEETPQEPQYEEWSDPFGGVYENDAVKKYVIYISKDFVPYIDDMDTDARSAFVNEALQLKTEVDRKDARWYMLRKMLRHVIISATVLLITVPCLFWLADKSIMATVENYSYVQKNFEKLYKDRADKDRIMRQMRLNNPPPRRP